MVFSSNRKFFIYVTFLLALITLTGCGGMIPAESWKMPIKEDAKSAMIVGRIGLAGNKPFDLMRAVTFQNTDKLYINSGNVPRGEEEFIMDNGYFVIPNIKPGKYRFDGFFSNDTYHRMSTDERDFYDIKPGEIKFVGSLDYTYIESESIFSRSSFNLKLTKNPSELEIMQWLLRTSQGSGWEPAITQRIKALEKSQH